MRALLLAAGYGSRLKPITNYVPKCLVEINGRPLLDYWLTLLEGSEITEVLINLHYLGGRVEDFIKRSNYQLQIELVNEEKLLGTGGTIQENMSWFKKEPTLVIHADNLSLFSMERFLQTFWTRGPDIEITMMTFITETPRTCGILEIDERGIVRALYEKVDDPPGKLANGAVYIFSSNVLEYIKMLSKPNLDISLDVLPHFIGKINTYHNDVYHRDIGNVESLQIAQKEYPMAGL